MRGAVTSHTTGTFCICFVNIDLHALSKRSFHYRQEKIKRFASSGISGHRKSGRTQPKLNGAEGCSLDPWATRQTSRPGVRLHKLRFEEL